jgi:hypothetical protein
VCGRGKLVVVLLVGEGREGRREAMGMRKTKLGSKFLLPRHAQVTPWRPSHEREQPRGARPQTVVGHNPALKFRMEVENGD